MYIIRIYLVHTQYQEPVYVIVRNSIFCNFLYADVYILYANVIAYYTTALMARHYYMIQPYITRPWPIIVIQYNEYIHRIYTVVLVCINRAESISISCASKGIRR